MKSIVPLISPKIDLSKNESINSQTFQNDKSALNFKKNNIVDKELDNKKISYNENTTTYRTNYLAASNNSTNKISCNDPSKTALNLFYQCKSQNKTINKKLNDSLLQFIQVNQNQLQKLHKNFSNTNKKTRNCKFSKDEDDMIINIVNKFGPKNWRIISSLIPGRTPRQCRDRYSNYLAPGFVHSNWTKEEDKLLADQYILLGPRWTKIQQCFPNRTANGIKNRFKYTVCRVMHILRPDIFFKNNGTEKTNQSNEIQKEKNENKNDNIFNTENDDFNFDPFSFDEQNLFF